MNCDPLPAIMRTLCLLLTVLLTTKGQDVVRCIADADCPAHAVCFKDECSRCICEAGHQLVSVYNGGDVSTVCQPQDIVDPKIGDSCGPEAGNLSSCPKGSTCVMATGRCECLPGLVPDATHAHCRRAMFGEECHHTRAPCETRMGLRCHGEHKTCECQRDLHVPGVWTEFVLRRWNYSRVDAARQDCVIRAVGEACSTNMQCAGVQGSGARCGGCGMCVCRRTKHVPDILGTKCGPPLSRGARCSTHGRGVCDGPRGLQCGDVCHLYSSDYAALTCTCSQMHVSRGSRCLPKGVGDPCSTDIDCSLITSGFGFCRKAECVVNVTAAPFSFKPYSVANTCRHHRVLPVYPLPTTPAHAPTTPAAYFEVLPPGELNLDQHHNKKDPVDHVIESDKDSDIFVDKTSHDVDVLIPQSLTGNATTKDKDIKVAFESKDWHYQGESVYHSDANDSFLIERAGRVEATQSPETHFVEKAEEDIGEDDIMEYANVESLSANSGARMCGCAAYGVVMVAFWSNSYMYLCFLR